MSLVCAQREGILQGYKEVGIIRAILVIVYHVDHREIIKDF